MICIGFASNKKGFIGKAIQLIQGNKWNHVFIVNLYSNTVWESNPGGIRKSDFKRKYIESDRYEIRIYRPEPKLGPIQEGLIAYYCEGAIGKYYDYLQILGLFLKIVFCLPTAPFNSRKIDICSEFVAKAFESVGVRVYSPRIKLRDVKPPDIYYYVIEMYWKIIKNEQLHSILY